MKVQDSKLTMFGDVDDSSSDNWCQQLLPSCCCWVWWDCSKATKHNELLRCLIITWYLPWLACLFVLWLFRISVFFSSLMSSHIQLIYSYFTHTTWDKPFFS